MNNAAFATIIGSALAAITIGLAAPAFAAPAGPSDRDHNGHGTSQFNGYPQGNQTPYGTYQNDDSRPGGRR